MTFQETLEVAKKNNILAWKLVVAYAVSIDMDLPEENYEQVCEFIYDWVSHTSMDVDELCDLISDCLEENLFTLEDFDSDWDKITDILNDKI